MSNAAPVLAREILEQAVGLLEVKVKLLYFQ
jgi:hypothetical protein